MFEEPQVSNWHYLRRNRGPLPQEFKDKFPDYDVRFEVKFPTRDLPPSLKGNRYAEREANWLCSKVRLTYIGANAAIEIDGPTYQHGDHRVLKNFIETDIKPNLETIFYNSVCRK